tara:strand:- start:370 stop:549 length:180 start_codon:yes stop_codon:yes gene_type:complete
MSDDNVTDNTVTDNTVLDRIIRQLISKERANYLENGEAARAIPSEIKKVIEDQINRKPR